jgi:hypothetical protein
VLFWVSPTRRLYDLFRGLHNLKEQKPEAVVALAAEYNVHFPAAASGSIRHVIGPRVETVIASHRVGAKRRPMTGSAKQSRSRKADWIASSLRSSQ